MVKVIGVHLAVHSESGPFVKSLQSTACGFELVEVRGEPGSGVSK